jgi:hypothetical protein
MSTESSEAGPTTTAGRHSGSGTTPPSAEGQESGRSDVPTTSSCDPGR